MINNYYILRDNEQQDGPYTHEELMNMDIDPQTRVQSPLNDTWQFAWQLPEFAEYFQQKDIYLPTLQNQAGFGWRFLAYLIDYALLMALVTVPTVVLETASELSGTNVSETIESLMGGVLVLTYLTYHPLFESLKTQGSIGKVICKIIVVDAMGQRISFWRALGRNVSKIFSSLLCGLGYLNIIWDTQKQGWHDKIASTYVIKKAPRTRQPIF